MLVKIMGEDRKQSFIADVDTGVCVFSGKQASQEEDIDYVGLIFQFYNKRTTISISSVI